MLFSYIDLYSATLLTLSTVSRSVGILGIIYVQSHIVWKINTLTSFSIWICLILFLWLWVSWYFQLYIEKEEQSWQPWLSPDFNGIHLNLPQVKIMLTVELSYLTFIVLMYISWSPITSRTFIMTACRILSKTFSDFNATITIIKNVVCWWYN